MRFTISMEKLEEKGIKIRDFQRLDYGIQFDATILTELGSPIIHPDGFQFLEKKLGSHEAETLAEKIYDIVDRTVIMKILLEE